MLLMSKKASKMTDDNLLVLVDTSYTSFYRFFATVRWYSFAFKEEYQEAKNNPDYDWLSNKVFIEKYEKMYMDSIIKLIGKKNVKTSKIIFCMDSPKVDLWRTQICSNYKGDRVDLSKKHDFKPTFDYTYSHIIPNLIKSNDNIKSIRVAHMEADDIIASICMYLKNTKPNQKILLISGDEDFLQLGRDNLSFVNYKLKKPKVLTEEEAKSELKKKIINGDTSDCIPSIFLSKISPKIKKAIIESDDELFKYLGENSEVLKRYDLNKKMIDFHFIPKKYYDNVIDIFTKI